jgi:hypothetical protein
MRVRRYRVDFPWLLATFARQLRIPRTIEPKCLVKDGLWELGPAWIGHRKHMTLVFLGRRFHHRDVLEPACHALRERANGRTALLLITGVAPPPFAMIPGQPVVVPLRRCLVIGAGLTVDADNLANHLGGNLPARRQRPLQITGEGRVVWFYGEKFEFPRGDQQRRIINYLHDQYLQGICEVSPAQIIADLELPEKTRIDKQFRRSRAWDRLLTLRAGMLTFRWPEGTGEATESVISG